MKNTSVLLAGFATFSSVEKRSNAKCLRRVFRVIILSFSKKQQQQQNPKTASGPLRRGPFGIGI